VPHDPVIRHGRVERDDWTILATADDAAPLPAGPLAVPLATWQARRAELLARTDAIGVVLGPADDPAALAGDLPAMALVAVRFPKFTDGRGYSIAVLLRTRYRYAGELRAIGDVGRDQLAYLRRCGFDAFSLPPHRDAVDALAGLAGISVRYQGAVDDAEPLFRKRLRHGAAHG
jgi:uncharacterized protein (DUF934 family)